MNTSCISRREFLAASAAGAALQWSPACGAAGGAAGIIDTHVYLGRWPFGRLACEEPAELVQSLRKRGVARAWTGTFEGLLHKDIAGANARLFEACQSERKGLLIPFGSVNPTLPDWQEDLRRCHEDFSMPGIRLHPNYHGYGLDEARFVEVLSAAATRGLVVQLVAWMDDQKYPYFKMNERHVDLAPLARHLKRVPSARVVLSNAVGQMPPARLGELAAGPGVYFDYAMAKSKNELNDLLKTVPPSRILFGSGFPRGDFQATLAILRNADLSEQHANAIRVETAVRMVKGEIRRVRNGR